VKDVRFLSTLVLWTIEAKAIIKDNNEMRSRRAAEHSLAF
jgi:hypothetical protein